MGVVITEERSQTREELQSAITSHILRQEGLFFESDVVEKTMQELSCTSGNTDYEQRIKELVKRTLALFVANRMLLYDDGPYSFFDMY